jgi:hypothetical protein
MRPLKVDYHLTVLRPVLGQLTHSTFESITAVGSPAPVSNWPRIRQDAVNNGHVLILQYRKIFTPTLISETSVAYSWRPWNAVPNAADLKANQVDTAGYTVGQFSPGINPRNSPVHFRRCNQCRQPHHGWPIPLPADTTSLLPATSLKFWAHTLKAGFT